MYSFKTEYVSILQGYKHIKMPLNGSYIYPKSRKKGSVLPTTSTDATIEMTV